MSVVKPISNHTWFQVTNIRYVRFYKNIFIPENLVFYLCMLLWGLVGFIKKLFDISKIRLSNPLNFLKFILIIVHILNNESIIISFIDISILIILFQIFQCDQILSGLINTYCYVIGCIMTWSLIIRHLNDDWVCMINNW